MKYISACSNLFPGSLAPEGRVGENPGNEVAACFDFRDELLTK